MDCQATVGQPSTICSFVALVQTAKSPNCCATALAYSGASTPRKQRCTMHRKNLGLENLFFFLKLVGGINPDFVSL